MRSTRELARGSLALVFVLGGVFIACSSSSKATEPRCTNGVRDGDESGVDCGGSCPLPCSGDSGAPGEDGGADGSGLPDSSASPRSDDNLQNGTETDVDCGGPNAPRCALGKRCLVDSDCSVACNYARTCVAAPSCKPHLGGDTCGTGEVGEPDARHESCCRSLPVTGFSDPRYPGKTVYLDKYEITAGRVRAFIDDVAARYGGKPNIQDWVVRNTPGIWDNNWNRFLPTDYEAGTVHVNRRLLGDPRGGPDEPPIPPDDQDQNVGINFQFNGQLFVYLHGNNCSTHVDGFGFPTFFYPAAVLARTGPATFPPRADGLTPTGQIIPASEHLDVKAMNCITNALLAAFCHWDGGQLATEAVLDYVTGSPAELGDAPGCGTQIGTENPPASAAATRGGRCADLAVINATYDAGGRLPVLGSPLNANNYVYPLFPEGTTHDKAWEIAAPGRGSRAAGGAQVDVVRLAPGDEPWVDLAGNLSEAVLRMSGSTFSGRFGLKYRGIGYQSARSELNIRDDWEGEGGIRRLARGEARAGFAGGRCMRLR